MKKYIGQALKLLRWVILRHHFPGRIRLTYKSGIFPQLLSYKSTDVEKILANMPAFKNYKIKNSTNSIVIEYDASVIRPEWINAMFSESDTEAKKACYEVARQLKSEGLSNE
ncbi:hypothetical protein GZ77_12005 [Endozoicomonas montiporae]|uniref:Uncharacterized protein n=2 Tax=Endozoicomonas montiporae TaxID=1027273 RepID=A0A081N934_9GAMM|nr:hypothetical protein [Endozoicomonas montiporae]AMO55105.1 hypothetical protein EZMO1_0888 [Endozoicomonas montiporae CL-33]KEQ14957.1 hypothetical protein GZ77_12005 [Endozoicomonas montiporae]